MSEHEDLINEESFGELLKAVRQKKRILLVGQPGAHGLVTLAMALLMHGDEQGYQYELFDSGIMRDRKGNGNLNFAQLKSTADIYTLLSLWAHGDGGVATIYAQTMDEATGWMGAVMKKGGIREPDAFLNCTMDVICMIETEGDSSVVMDVVVLHH